ncbi:hypothetical protein E8E11_002843 [Didymella keratinophila]|nr:hypothetical protein E8E11_002843 [Didymella keratinophila]
MLRLEYLTYGLAVSTGALLGWNVKSAQHMIAPGNHVEFEQFIAHARASKHVHPNFIANVETLYRSMI